MSRILYGPPVAERLREELRLRIDGLKARGVEPCLALVRVGAEPGSLCYERSTLRACETVGIAARQLILPEDSDTETLAETLHALSTDPLVHGCLPLRPLPRQIDETRAWTALSPEKDVDGVTDSSLRRVFVGRGPGYCPCTPEAVLELLNAYEIRLEGKRAAVIGRSLVVGRPLALLLTGRDATVTLCHRGTGNLPEICREADILISTAGSVGLVGPDFVREGQVVVDVGTTPDAEGRLSGDVRFADVEPLVAAISPVPRGVGALTTTVLLRHVVEAAETLA